MLEELKSMDREQLNALADELRKELIENTSKTGGHLASNLGVVELTIALHRVFDTPKDKLIWDVGHQAYVHKMLTGRRDQMNTLRQFGGLSGFPKRAESEHDMFDSGHSGGSISAALGFAYARDLKGEDYSCVAVIGDGALTGGVAFEAMNAAGSSKSHIIVVLNDNEMSISKNVGGLSRHLQKLRMTNAYLGFKRNIKSATENSPGLYRFLSRIRDAIKFAFMPGVVFEELGFKYFGPIDGHDEALMEQYFSRAKDIEGPVMIHVITKKGKGFAPAEENPAKYHGVGRFDPKTADSRKEEKHGSWSEVFGKALLEEARADSSIVAVTAAMTDGTGLTAMKEAYPQRVVDAAIAEQHAVSFAAGAALNGLKPVVAIYSTFLQRAYDQVLTEVCLQNLPVIFAVDRAGITGGDGETHQGAFDIEYLSSMPNMTIFSPKNDWELKMMLKTALRLGTPVAIRYPRGNAPAASEEDKARGFKPSTELAADGKDMLILADGAFAGTARAVRELLKAEGIDVGVADIKVIKPVDPDFLEYCGGRGYKLIAVLEDGDSYNGYGTVFASKLDKYSCGTQVECFGWPDSFIQHGTVDELRTAYGLDPQWLSIRIRESYMKIDRKR